MDASVAQKAILNCQINNVTELNIIHDAFWTVAPSMPVMREALTTNVIDIFSEDLLLNFKKELSHYLPSGVELPDPPEVGTLDINRVRDSNYFFS